MYPFEIIQLQCVCKNENDSSSDTILQVILMMTREQSFGMIIPFYFLKLPWAIKTQDLF